MIQKVLSKLKKEYPTAKCSLDFENPLQLLIATMLAAQCTDERVNIVTKDLFKKYKTVSDYANADIEELESQIRSTGFYHNKAKNIINCCKKVMLEYSGELPQSMDQLVTLSGVGRKTANVLLHNAFNRNEGIVVDTHCKRVSKRLGLTKQDDPIKVEQDLMSIIPKNDWSIYGHLLVFHGRALCKARKPNCSSCILQDECPKIEVNN